MDLISLPQQKHWGTEGWLTRCGSSAGWARMWLIEEKTFLPPSSARGPSSVQRAQVDNLKGRREEDHRECQLEEKGDMRWSNGCIHGQLWNSCLAGTESLFLSMLLWRSTCRMMSWPPMLQGMVFFLKGRGNSGCKLSLVCFDKGWQDDFSFGV